MHRTQNRCFRLFCALLFLLRRKTVRTIRKLAIMFNLSLKPLLEKIPSKLCGGQIFLVIIWNPDGVPIVPIASNFSPAIWAIGTIWTIGQAKSRIYTRNTRTQQTLARPSNTSLENPSNIDNFSKLSKRQIVLSITGRGNEI